MDQLNEQSIIIVVNLMKKILDDSLLYKEKKQSSKKMAAFNKLMELREEFAAANLPPIDEIRREAIIEEKYGYRLNPKRNNI